MKFLLMRRVDKARVCFTAVLGHCPANRWAALRYFSTRGAKKSAGWPAGEVCSDARVDQNSRTVLWTDTARAAALLFAAGTVSALAPAAAYTRARRIAMHCQLATPLFRLRRKRQRGDSERLSLVRLESENAHATRV